MQTVKFDNMAAQGDLLIRKIDKLPDDAKAQDAENGRFILAHSETGHCHVVKQDKGLAFYANQNNPLVAYLVVNNTTCLLEHEKSFDTHSPIKIKKGIYEIRRQREHTPNGWIRVAD